MEVLLRKFWEMWSVKYFDICRIWPRSDVVEILVKGTGFEFGKIIQFKKKMVPFPTVLSLHDTYI